MFVVCLRLNVEPQPFLLKYKSNQATTQSERHCRCGPRQEMNTAPEAEVEGCAIRGSTIGKGKGKGKANNESVRSANVGNSNTQSAPFANVEAGPAARLNVNIDNRYYRLGPNGERVAREVYFKPIIEAMEGNCLTLAHIDQELGDIQKRQAT